MSAETDDTIGENDTYFSADSERPGDRPVEAHRDPDVLVLAFQELDLSTEALLYSTKTIREDAWTTAIFAALGERAETYEKVRQVSPHSLNSSAQRPPARLKTARRDAVNHDRKEDFKTLLHQYRDLLRWFWYHGAYGQQRSDRSSSHFFSAALVKPALSPNHIDLCQFASCSFR